MGNLHAFEEAQLRPTRNELFVVASCVGMPDQKWTFARRNSLLKRFKSMRSFLIAVSAFIIIGIGNADPLLAQLSTDAPGSIAAQRTVSLANFVHDENPLQAALNALGGDGGTILVPQQEWMIPQVAVSAIELRNLKIKGEGPGSALVFPNGGGGLRLTFATPSSVEMEKDQLVVEGLSFLTTHVAPDGSGSGAAIYAKWATAVGDTSQGSTFRDVQLMPKNKNAVKGQYAYWDIGISLENARQNTLNNVVIAGGALQVKGVGVELKGGTVPTLLSNISCSGLDKCIYAHGISEGIDLADSTIVHCNYKLYADGDLIGSARSSSATSSAIGLGTKTFEVQHKNLAWTTPHMRIHVRDIANPTKNYMIGSIVSYSGTSVVVNVTEAKGSGIFANWTLSPEHKISDIKIHDTHGSIVKSQVWARWTAFVFYHDNMDQKREGTSEEYADLTIVDHNTLWFINNNVFIQRGRGGSTKGIVLQGNANVNISISQIWFVNRDVGILVGPHAAQVNIADVYAVGDVANLIESQSQQENSIRIRNALERPK